MASVTSRITTPSTTDGSSFTTGAFTPVSNSLLVAVVTAAETTAAGALVNSAGLSFTKVASSTKNSGQDTIYVFVSDAKASAVSQDCTFSCAGDPATGAIVTVLGVTGMTRSGASAVRQVSIVNNASSGAIPSASLPSAALTTNPMIGVVGISRSIPGLSQPSGWNELVDSGFGTPVTGHEIASKDSGFTGTTVTWGSSALGSFGVVAIELDASSSVSGSLDASESGVDSAQISGVVVFSGVSGSLSASESGQDSAIATGSVAVAGGLSVSESGHDAAHFLGVASSVSGDISASEIGADSALVDGSVLVTGTLSASDVGTDTALSVGSVVIVGALAVSEVGSDSAQVAGSVAVTGTLSTSESGSDTAQVSGEVYRTEHGQWVGVIKSAGRRISVVGPGGGRDFIISGSRIFLA